MGKDFGKKSTLLDPKSPPQYLVDMPTTVRQGFTLTSKLSH
jgi:hypothetical protein